MIRPRGYPPTPSAISRPSEPVGTVATSSWSDSPSFKRMMAPLPYSFSTLAMASSSAADFCFAVLSSVMGSYLTGHVFRLQGVAGQHGFSRPVQGSARQPTSDVIAPGTQERKHLGLM